MVAATALKRVFAANRSAGRLALTVAAADGVTRRKRVYEDGPLRARFPNTDGDALEAVIVNTAGGIAGGDSHAFDISLGENAALTMTTAAAEKVYRALDDAAEISVKLSAAPGARLLWVPQETILFDRVRLNRTIDIDLTGNASVVVAESVYFGRTAMGEIIQQGSFTDCWRLRRDGKLVFAETIKFDGAIAQKLAEPAVAKGGVAIATVLIAPGDDALVERVRAQTFCGETGISCWNGLAVARLCAKDGATLRRDLVAVLTALGTPLPRIWLN
jgi:urease accessory protein